jgi:hypothetical protein
MLGTPRKLIIPSFHFSFPATQFPIRRTVCASVLRNSDYGDPQSPPPSNPGTEAPLHGLDVAFSPKSASTRTSVGPHFVQPLSALTPETRLVLCTCRWPELGGKASNWSKLPADSAGFTMQTSEESMVLRVINKGLVRSLIWKYTRNLVLRVFGSVLCSMNPSPLLFQRRA